MCGIAGRINLDFNNPVQANDLKQMGDVIINRGPDDEGYFINSNVGFVFRRLSIIDLANGHQPMCNENGRVWIVFNGEIYNYRELKEFLINKGHKFATNSDTEVIVHLYEEHGELCVKYLRGMFAFAIWDDDKKTLFCARDRFGIKPFYYYLDNEKFLFGSEIKSFLHVDGVDTSICYKAVDMYFTYGYTSNSKSIYKHIQKLGAGHYMTISFRHSVPSVQVVRYWRAAFTPDFSVGESDWTKQIEEAASESVKLHMESDVPIGAFLSGGIDSSTVVALMSRHATRRFKTFSIGFKQAEYNELPLAREVAKMYGCEHHEQILEPESIALLPKLVEAYDEPFADSSAIPTYYVSKFASEYVKVILSGDGGDELFGGYWNYQYLGKIYRRSSRMPSLNRVLWGTIHSAIPDNYRGKNLTYFLSKNRNFLGAYMNVWNKRERSHLILNDYVEHPEYYAEEYKEKILREKCSLDFTSKLQALDIETYLVDDILTKVDRASMMNSLEVRVPLLDHKLAELSFSIPSRFKLKGGDGKYILKRAMASLLPPAILAHKKQGFSVPLSYWFKDDLRDYIGDTLLSGNSLLSSYLDANYIKYSLSVGMRGKRDYTAKIWSLIFFEEWLRSRKGD